ncbi:hypothetical protein EUX98_g5667 [Antrodiella citrinella]|uniref:Ketoreductase (KR) domain-containing protein n=1 Tax=Antrodiella citrinella TaxID=2447956 RepID=A0A4S4MYM6_9APHY|nr:hypothetical protein EUX98_g5667 [Antrodiella citrinella]
MTGATNENSKFVSQNLFNVEGWTCVVTGVATGIDLMIAQAFANNGARVYIVGRRADALQTTIDKWGSLLAHQQGKMIPLTADITDKAPLEMLAKDIGSKEKKVGVLVNNAGINLGTSEVSEKGRDSVKALQKELCDEKQENWEAVYRTNVIASSDLCISDADLDCPGHTGPAINVSSISGITRTTHQPGVKVRVNSIAPGIFPADTSDDQNKSRISTGGSYGEKKGIPAGRAGDDEDMAQIALFLACNEYMYGQVNISVLPLVLAVPTSPKTAHIS